MCGRACRRLATRRSTSDTSLGLTARTIVAREISRATRSLADRIGSVKPNGGIPGSYFQQDFGNSAAADHRLIAKSHQHLTFRRSQSLIQAVCRSSAYNCPSRVFWNDCECGGGEDRSLDAQRRYQAFALGEWSGQEWTGDGTRDRIHVLFSQEWRTESSAQDICEAPRNLTLDIALISTMSNSTAIRRKSVSELPDGLSTPMDHMRSVFKKWGEEAPEQKRKWDYRKSRWRKEVELEQTRKSRGEETLGIRATKDATEETWEEAGSFLSTLISCLESLSSIAEKEPHDNSRWSDLQAELEQANEYLTPFGGSVPLTSCRSSDFLVRRSLGLLDRATAEASFASLVDAALGVVDTASQTLGQGHDATNPDPESSTLRADDWTTSLATYRNRLSGPVHQALSALQRPRRGQSLDQYSKKIRSKLQEYQAELERTPGVGRDDKAEGHPFDPLLKQVTQILVALQAVSVGESTKTSAGRTARLKREKWRLTNLDAPWHPSRKVQTTLNEDENSLVVDTGEDPLMAYTLEASLPVVQMGSRAESRNFLADLRQEVLSHGLPTQHMKSELASWSKWIEKAAALDKQDEERAYLPTGGLDEEGMELAEDERSEVKQTLQNCVRDLSKSLDEPNDSRWPVFESAVLEWRGLLVGLSEKHPARANDIDSFCKMVVRSGKVAQELSEPVEVSTRIMGSTLVALKEMITKSEGAEPVDYKWTELFNRRLAALEHHTLNAATLLRIGNISDGQREQIGGRLKGDLLGFMDSLGSLSRQASEGLHTSRDPFKKLLKYATTMSVDLYDPVE